MKKPFFAVLLLMFSAPAFAQVLFEVEFGVFLVVGTSLAGIIILLGHTMVLAPYIYFKKKSNEYKYNSSNTAHEP